MATLKHEVHNSPHIEFRDVLGNPEAHVSGSGLSVWEIAWLARAYDRDVYAIAEHTGSSPELVSEGLRYASEHSHEIDAQIARHTERPLEELLDMFPGVRIETIERINSNSNRD